jgi:hypothetical protein
MRLTALIVACVLVLAALVVANALRVGDELRMFDGLYVDKESLGGACSDDRTPDEAGDPETPWCTIARSVVAAPPGSTVRVRAGDYGRLEIHDLRREPAVTLQPERGEVVELSGGLSIEDAAGYRVEGFRITSPGFTSSIFRSRRIEVVRNELSPRGLLLRAVEEVLVEGNDLHDIAREAGKPAPDGYALSVLGHSTGAAGERVRGLIVRGNRFRNVPNDAIQLGGGPERMLDVTIEGNEFSGVRRRVETDHPDSIQVLGGDGITIRSNYFHDSEVALMIKDDVTRRLTVENNVMVGADGGGIQAQLWDTPEARVVRNTIWNSRLGGLRFAEEGECCGVPHGIVLRGNIIDKYDEGDAAWFSEQDHNVILAGPRRGAHDVVVTAPRFDSRWRPLGGVAGHAGARLSAFASPSG